MGTAQPVGLFEAIYTTRALRRLRPEAVPNDALFQVLDAAIRAPSGQNAQDWRFVVITDSDLKQRMQSWTKEGWSQYESRFGDAEQLSSLPRTQRLSLQSVGYLANHLGEAPVIVAVCGKRGRHSTPGGSTFPAVQNLLLAARAVGLGASVFNFPLRHHDELAEALGVPDDNQIFCLVPIGYPIDKRGPVRRKPVKKVTYWNRWEQPWKFAEEQPEVGWQGKWVPSLVKEA